MNCAMPIWNEFQDLIHCNHDDSVEDDEDDDEDDGEDDDDEMMTMMVMMRKVPHRSLTHHHYHHHHHHLIIFIIFNGIIMVALNEVLKFISNWHCILKYLTTVRYLRMPTLPFCSVIFLLFYSLLSKRFPIVKSWRHLLASSIDCLGTRSLSPNIFDVEND